MPLLFFFFKGNACWSSCVLTAIAILNWLSCLTEEKIGVLWFQNNWQGVLSSGPGLSFRNDFTPSRDQERDGQSVLQFMAETVIRLMLSTLGTKLLPQDLPLSLSDLTIYLLLYFWCFFFLTRSVAQADLDLHIERITLNIGSS